MKNFTNKNLASKHVCFLEGFSIRRGVVLGRTGGVWRVDCAGEIVSVWEDDIFTDSAQAQHVLNAMIN